MAVGTIREEEVDMAEERVVVATLSNLSMGGITIPETTLTTTTTIMVVVDTDKTAMGRQRRIPVEKDPE